MLDAAAGQLRHVGVAEPVHEFTRRVGFVRRAKGADAKAGDGKAVLVGVHAAQGLAENFRYAVTRIGSGLRVGVDDGFAAVKADDMV